jgi:hypothetical protein
MTLESMEPSSSSIVRTALAEVRALLPPGAELGDRRDDPLAHPEGPLDSLGIVNLVASVEGAAAREGLEGLGLVDALALPLEESPFRTVGSLEDWVTRVTGRSDGP